MIKIELGDRIFNIPESWDECSSDLALKLGALSSCFGSEVTKSHISRYAVWIEIVRLVLADAGDKKFDKFWKKLTLSPEQLEYLKDLVAWVAIKPEGKYFESFELKGIKYYVVEPRFKNTIALEWTEGLMDFIELTSTSKLMDQNIDALSKLNLLIGNFCRPEREDLEAWRKNSDYNGDKREPWNRARAIERAEELADLPDGVKVMFLWWFEALIKDFFDEYREIFGSGNKNQKKDDESDGRYADGRGFLMVLKNAAKSHYMGDFDKVCNTDVGVVYSLILDDWYDNNEVKI